MRLLLIFFLFFGFSASAEPQETQIGPVEVTKMIDGLDAPWAIAFVPGGGVLITERDGALFHFHEGEMTQVKGVPKVFNEGQGGLLDVIISNRFERTREIFLSYAARSGRKGGTALMRARLSADHKWLTNQKVLFEMDNKTASGRHFGSRIVQAKNGDLFVSVGDRGDDDQAQNLANANGTIQRISKDGRVQTHSYGHRNPQGMAIDAKGRIWAVEHGARGGDEVNLVKKDANYGWPVISYGTHYNGRKIGVGTRQKGMEQPNFYWDPSIAPSGMMIYQGDMFPEWQGNMFIGSLKFDYISRLTIANTKVAEQEHLFKDTFARIRDIRQAPDGSIWFISIGDGAVYKIHR